MDDNHQNRTLAIVGGGGLGRELESWLCKSNLINEYHLVGYLDDNKDSLIGYQNDFSVVDAINPESLKTYGNILIGVANCKFKEELFKAYKKYKNFNILSFIHSSVVLGKHLKIENGVIISPNVVLSCNTSIKDGVFINIGSQIGHDVTIDCYSSIMANVDIGGGAHIGKNVTIGTGAVILPKVKIPDNVFIGAGSVVIRSFKKEGTYFGNPAKKIF